MRRLKTSKIQIKELIEKEKDILSDIGEKYVEGSYRQSIKRL